MGGTVGDQLEAATRRLKSAGSLSPRLDAELLMAGVTGWCRPEVLAHPKRTLSVAVERAFHALVGRREANEPIAYLLGEREFYGRTFRVDHRALIPRPETELLVELGRSAVGRLRSQNVKPVLVDVGTGCGAIGISLALESRVRVVGTDVSTAALSLARENARLLRADVALVQTDLVSGLRGPLHVVLANLPYVPRDRALPSDVADYEPHVALFGGRRGTELIERLLSNVRPLLAPAAEVAVELDEEEQAAPIAALARQLYSAAEVDVFRDAGGYDRVVRVVLSPPPAG
jgi:release factor glutamine methyltransferase